MKKRAIGIALALATFAGVGAFAGCNDTESTEQKQNEKKIMQLSLNPSVEFVLDENDTVVSANATNEEGNLILTAQTFTGKSASEAAELFVQVSKETGFLVKGNVKTGENEITISFSGDTEDAKTLFNAVKGEIQTYLTEQNVTAQVEQSKAIAKEELEKLVAECAPYLTEAEITVMSYNELMETLLASRKETAELYSQELKNAYYSAKAFALEQAELETLKTHLSEIQKIAYTVAYTGYTEAVSVIEQTRLTMLVNADSPYQLALAEFREAKADYLEYRNYVASLEETEVTKEISEKLAQYQTVLDGTEEKLLQAGKNANLALDTAKTQLKVAYDAVVKMLDDASVKANAYAEEISANQKTATTAFFEKFETDYAQAKNIAKTGWTDMKNKLKNGEE